MPDQQVDADGMAVFILKNKLAKWDKKRIKSNLRKLVVMLPVKD